MSAPLHSGWPESGAYGAGREGLCVLACVGGIRFESNNGVCKKVEFSFWLFVPNSVIL